MKLLLTDRLHSDFVAKLKAHPSIEVYRSVGRQPNFEEIKDTEILIIRSSTKITVDLIQKAEKLKLIITTTSGFNHIDIGACQQAGIICCYCPDANRKSASELVFYHILNFYKKRNAMDKAIDESNWEKDRMMGWELSDKKLGIIGLGRIGKQVAKIANAFDMEVLAFDPFIESIDFESVNAKQMGMDELICSADIVSLHVPFTPLTKRMIKAHHYDAMMDHSILINCARGNLLCESELLQAINEQKIAGACLDVFEREPVPADSQLIAEAKIQLSPHNGGNTEESFYKAGKIAYDKVIQYLNGEDILDTLPPNVEWNM